MFRSILCALAVAATAASPAAAATSCKSKALTGITTAATPFYTFERAQAQTLARQHWEMLCSKRYGGIWCNLHKAAAKTMVCNLQPSGIGGLAHVCEFHAKPCKNT